MINSYALLSRGSVSLRNRYSVYPDPPSLRKDWSCTEPRLNFEQGYYSKESNHWQILRMQSPALS